MKLKHLKKRGKKEQISWNFSSKFNKGVVSTNHDEQKLQQIILNKSLYQQIMRNRRKKKKNYPGVVEGRRQMGTVVDGAWLLPVSWMLRRGTGGQGSSCWCGGLGVSVAGLRGSGKGRVLVWVYKSILTNEVNTIIMCKVNTIFIYIK